MTPYNFHFVEYNHVIQVTLSKNKKQLKYCIWDDISNLLPECVVQCVILTTDLIIYSFPSDTIYVLAYYLPLTWHEFLMHWSHC